MADEGRNHQRLMQTPEYGLLDVVRFLKGSLVSADTLGRALLQDPSIQPVALPAQFEIPVFFISGRRDHFTPTDLAAAFLASVDAPDKAHVVFEESGHYPHEDAPDRFLATLLRLVGPHLGGPNATSGSKPAPHPHIPRIRTG